MHICICILYSMLYAYMGQLLELKCDLSGRETSTQLQVALSIFDVEPEFRALLKHLLKQKRTRCSAVRKYKYEKKSICPNKSIH